MKVTLALLAIFALVATATALPHKQHPGQNTNVEATQNIVQLAQSLGLTTLVSLAVKANLQSTLETATLTLAGPTNAAFAALNPAIVKELTSNITLLTDVLTYHATAGRVYSTSLKNELTVPSLFENRPIRANIYQNGKIVTLEGSPVAVVDQNATNGVIHVVNRVLFPSYYSDIPTFVTNDRYLSTLKIAVVTANLVAALQGGPFTLFAPTNEAFAKLPNGTLEALLNNIPALTKVLTYHLVSGTYYSAGLASGAVPTVNGATVNVAISSTGVFVNNARVEEADVSVTNGVIHIIDTVLIPPSVFAELKL